LALVAPSWGRVTVALPADMPVSSVDGGSAVHRIDPVKAASWLTRFPSRLVCRARVRWHDPTTGKRPSKSDTFKSEEEDSAWIAEYRTRSPITALIRLRHRKRLPSMGTP
jgi:hypothetical protein